MEAPGWSATVKAGTPLFMMPALCTASFSTVSPSKLTWSRPSDVMPTAVGFLKWLPNNGLVSSCRFVSVPQLASFVVLFLITSSDRRLHRGSWMLIKFFI